MSLEGPCVVEGLASRMVRVGRTSKVGPDERSLDHWGCTFHGDGGMPAFSFFFFFFLTSLPESER